MCPAVLPARLGEPSGMLGSAGQLWHWRAMQVSPHSPLGGFE